MSHTPPPWLYRGKSSTVHRPCPSHPYGEQIFGFHDVEFDDRTPNDDDLRLILQAPGLLAAARRYLEFRHTSDVGQGECYQGEHPETQLRKVIENILGFSI
jgi:hypothetical protein